MTTQNPGPDPDEVPELQTGGGVEPGDTPPDAGQTSGLSHPQPMPGKTLPIVVIGVVVVIVLAMVLFFVARVVDLF